MLYFEKLLVAKVIYDVINPMNKYLMTYANYDVYAIYDFLVTYQAHPVIYPIIVCDILLAGITMSVINQEGADTYQAEFF